MATETLTELELFHQYLSKELARGRKRMSVQESVERFDAYRRELAKLNAALRPAIEELERGGGGPIDWDEFYRRGRERLREKGITE